MFTAVNAGFDAVLGTRNKGRIAGNVVIEGFDSELAKSEGKDGGLLEDRKVLTDATVWMIVRLLAIALIKAAERKRRKEKEKERRTCEDRR